MAEVERSYRDVTGLRISRLHVVDTMKLVEAVVIPDQRTLTIVEGPNAAGKTTLLRCIQMGLGGKRVDPDTPIRNGATESEIELILADDLRDRYKLTLRHKGDRRYFEVRWINKDGSTSKIQKPQSVIDALTAEACWDIRKFHTAKPAEQLEMLISALGLRDQFNVLAKRKRDALDAKNENDATKKSLETRISNTPDPSPNKELTQPETIDITAQIAAATKTNQEHDKLEGLIAQTATDVGETIRKIAELNDRLTQLKSEGKVHVERTNQIPPRVNADELTAQLEDIENKREAARLQKQAREWATELTATKATAEEIDEELDAIKDRQKTIITETDIGETVRGLSSDGIQLMHDNLPLTQASGSQKLTIAALVGMSQKTPLNVICADEADGLDSNAIAMLRTLAKERGYQLWMTGTRIGCEADDDTTLVELRDGRQQNPPTQKDINLATEVMTQRKDETIVDEDGFDL